MASGFVGGGSTRPLTERSAVELARAICEQSVSAREVVEAHVALARQAHPRIGAVVAERFDDALGEAEPPTSEFEAAATLRRCSACRARSRSLSR